MFDLFAPVLYLHTAQEKAVSSRVLVCHTSTPLDLQTVTKHTLAWTHLLGSAQTAQTQLRQLRLSSDSSAQTAQTAQAAQAAQLRQLRNSPEPSLQSQSCQCPFPSWPQHCKMSPSAQLEWSSLNPWRHLSHACQG